MCLLPVLWWCALSQMVETLGVFVPEWASNADSLRTCSMPEKWIQAILIRWDFGKSVICFTEKDPNDILNIQTKLMLFFHPKALTPTAWAISSALPFFPFVHHTPCSPSWLLPETSNPICKHLLFQTMHTEYMQNLIPSHWLLSCQSHLDHRHLLPG